MKLERNDRVSIFIAMLAAFLAYVRTLTYPFLYDDGTQIVLNPRITSWHYFGEYFTTHVWAHMGPSVHANYYRPVFLLWMRVTDMLGGLDPRAWHLSALLVHVVVVGLVYLVAKRFLGTWQGALTAALLFALHPVHIESVAWVSGATDPLMCVFLLASFLLFQDVVEAHEMKWARLLGSVLLFLLALGTKETAIIFPGILLAYVLTQSQPVVSGKNKLMFASACFGFATVLYLFARHQALGGMANVRSGVDWMSVVLTLPSVVMVYIGNLCLSIPIAIYYGTPFIHSTGSSGFLKPLAGMIAVVSASLFVFLMVSPETRKKLWFALAAMLLPMAPVASLAFARDSDFVHDRYLYLPSVAFCILLAGAIERLQTWLEEKKGVNRTAGLALPAVALSVLYFAGTYYQEQQWSNETILFQHAVEVSRTNPMAYIQMGMIADAHNEPKLADRMYILAYQADQSSYAANLMMASVAQGQGDLASSERYFLRALSIDSRDGLDFFHLAQLQKSMGHLKDAETSVRSAIERQPQAKGYHLLLGKILLQQGGTIEARAAFAEELKYDSSNEEAKTALHLLDSPVQPHRKADGR